ncbi:MAG: hypothetical protein M0Z77_04465 [Thermoplasmatales archaeon]|nr:hypothetical protein [Thermoplasmatales archaeon]
MRGRQLEIPLEEAEAVTRRISRKRSLVEYPYAIMKRVFHFSHVMVILTRRVKFMFACFAYNLHAVKILQG